jgi:hypothetical protein
MQVQQKYPDLLFLTLNGAWPLAAWASPELYKSTGAGRGAGASAPKVHEACDAGGDRQADTMHIAAVLC